MDLGLGGLNVLVTGGAGGIGAAIVYGAIAEGASVIVADIDRVSGEKLVAEIPDNKASFVHTDLSNITDIDRLYATVCKTHGSVDVIVQVAKLFEFELFSRWEDIGRLKRQLDLFLGVAELSRKVWQGRPDGKKVGIVLISSVVGPRWGERTSIAYGTANGTYEGFCASLATEMGADGWSVVVAPGHTWTRPHMEYAQKLGLSRTDYAAQAANVQRTTQGRHMEASEVAGTVLFAASPIFGPTLTGKTITPDMAYTSGGGHVYPETSSAAPKSSHTDRE